MKIDRTLLAALALGAGVISTGSYIVGKSTRSSNGEVSFKGRDEPGTVINVAFPIMQGRKKLRNSDFANLGKIVSVEYDKSKGTLLIKGENGNEAVAISTGDVNTVVKVDGNEYWPAGLKEKQEGAHSKQDSKDAKPSASTARTGDSKPAAAKDSEKVGTDQKGKPDLDKVTNPEIDKSILERNPLYGVTMMDVRDANQLEPLNEASLEHKVYWFRAIAGYPPEGEGDLKIYPTNAGIKDIIKEHCASWDKDRPDAVKNASYIFWCTNVNLTDDMTGKSMDERTGYLRE